MPAPKKRRQRTRAPRSEVIHNYYGKPLTTALARSHIVGLFARRPAWNRLALIQAVVEAHSQAGGIEGDRTPMMCVNDALQGLKKVGVVNNEVVGLWRLVNKLPATVKRDEQALLDMEIEEVTPVESHTSEIASSEFRAELQPPSPTLLNSVKIGQGNESISVLFNPNDQRLAELEGRTYWECLITRSAAHELPMFSRQPITGLVIHCKDAATVEKFLQTFLNLGSNGVGGRPNSGWYCTSPDVVKQWYATLLQDLPQLSAAL